MHLKSLQVRTSPIGHIAMAVALLGQGDREVNLVFESGTSRGGNHARRVPLQESKKYDDDEATYLCTEARVARDADDVLAAMHMKKENYGRAVSLIEHAEKS
ncbi:hypothetical protein EDC04DRAFT_3091795 [Pisolithus marmoratus]|nr:hypothetical protein EDC04DRAFT_3091795 [Pisolithus marmoratus]